MKRLTVALVFVFLAAFALWAGGQSDKGASAAPATSTTNALQDWRPSLPQAVKKYSPPVEIDATFTGEGQYIPGEDMLNNKMTQRLRDNLGIVYKAHWVGTGDVYTQKFAADVAAGTLPDVFALSGADLARFIDDGLIADIKSIWERTATPLLKQKKGYPDNKDLWQPVLKGDKLWGIGFNYGPSNHVDAIPFIRRDLVDKLGLKVPETVDQLGDVLKAMVRGGVAKIGLFACKDLITWYHGTDPIFGAFGVMPKNWVAAPDGSLRYDSLSAANKDALAVLAKWYKDGILDPDFFTYDLLMGSGTYLGGNDVSGAWFAPWWHPFYLQPLIDQNPGMKIERFSYPKGPSGQQGRKASGFGGAAVAFRKGLDPVKIEAMINEMNWHMDRHVNYEKYQQYGEYLDGQGFFEGYEWIFDKSGNLAPGPIEDSFRYLGYTGMDYPFLCYEDYQTDGFTPVQRWMKASPTTLNKAQRFLAQNPKVQSSVEQYLYVSGTRNIAIKNLYKGQPTQDMRNFLPELNKMEDKVFMDIVTGEAPMSTFDTFVNDWKRTGGDVVTRDVNIWWKANK